MSAEVVPFPVCYDDRTHETFCYIDDDGTAIFVRGLDNVPLNKKNRIVTRTTSKPPRKSA